MTLPLTPEMMASAYDFLRTTPPFRRWKLPDSDAVVFRVGARQREAGRYQWDGEHHTITISVNGVGHSDSMLRFMAHEMIHLYLEAKGWESKARSEEVHNTRFRRFAAQVCKYHGFDLKAFY